MNTPLLAALPATLGVLVMTAIAYAAHRGHESAGWIILGGAAAGALSLILAARSGRAAPREPRAESPGEAEAGPREREYAALVRGTADEVARRIDEVRMPLHVLLTAPFGELNENQEEMIGAARAAADALAEEVHLVSRLLDLESGHVRPDVAPIQPRDLLAPVLAAAGDRFQSAGAFLESDVAPALPAVRIDARLTREALSLILAQAAHEPGARTLLTARAARGGVILRIESSSLAPGARLPLAMRLLRLQGAEATPPAAGVLEVRLPAAAE